MRFQKLSVQSMADQYRNRCQIDIDSLDSKTKISLSFLAASSSEDTFYMVKAIIYKIP